MPNRLADATSPYLLQHADNPVDWREWSEEAFDEARERDVPVLLSVGYSACHWCHVMAHESFEDEPTAAFMNDHFVNIKVDREERPDIDRIYMDAVQAMTGHGGWPMTVFMAPDGRPFFAGTYFPKEPRGPYPTFRTVLESIVHAWEHRREELEDQTARLTAAVRTSLPAADDRPETAGALRDAVAGFLHAFDSDHGGFGAAPKFPQAPSLEFLLRAFVLGIVDESSRSDTERALTVTLDRMARGGIYDQVGGGFARYAVDRIWLVPHFEKMLYDNAQLARIYLRAWQVLGDEQLLRVTTETLDYLLRDLRHPDGGFFSAEDADSEGVEGKFYVWTDAEIREVLTDDAEFAIDLYGVTPAGNFEGASILHLPHPLDTFAVERGLSTDEVLSRKRHVDRRLREVRDGRVRPGLDDKIVTAWNGLAIRAFAEAGAVLGETRYLDAATAAAEFVTAALVRDDGRVLRSWRDGRAVVPGFCDDYAALATGLFVLYQATGEVRWYEGATTLTEQLISLFAAPDGGFYATADDAETLITRPKNLFDNPVPSDNSLAAEALQFYGGLTGDAKAHEHLDAVVRAAARLVEAHPTSVAHLLSVLAAESADLQELAIVGAGSAELADVYWERFRPDVVLATTSAPTDAVPLLAGRTAGDGHALAYLCREFVCRLPVGTPDALRALLD